MIVFLVELILTNLIFSAIICGASLRFKNQAKPSSLEFLLFSLGLGPAFTTLLLYYLLLFLPRQSTLFYLLFVVSVYLFLAIWGRRQFLPLLKDFLEKVNEIKVNFKRATTSRKIETIIFSSLLLLFFVSFISLYLSHTLFLPLDGTDALKYGTLGKIFYSEKSMAYRWIRPYPKTGFYFDMNSAPSFSLLMTWERILDSFFHQEKDLYYKSVSAYYALLILGLFIFWLSKLGKYLALLGTLALISSFSFFQTLITQHLDSYRIFLLMVSWICLAYALKDKNFFFLLLLGISSGLAAFAHTIGAILATFNCLALLIFLEGGLRARFRKTALAGLLVILFGWFHYLLDIFFGFGWIFFNRTITFWG